MALTHAGDFSRSVIVIQQLVFCGIVLYLGFKKSDYFIYGYAKCVKYCLFQPRDKKTEFLIYNSAYDNMDKKPSRTSVPLMFCRDKDKMSAF